MILIGKCLIKNSTMKTLFYSAYWHFHGDLTDFSIRGSRLSSSICALIAISTPLGIIITNLISRTSDFTGVEIGYYTVYASGFGVLIINLLYFLRVKSYIFDDQSYKVNKKKPRRIFGLYLLISFALCILTLD